MYTSFHFYNGSFSVEISQPFDLSFLQSFPNTNSKAVKNGPKNHEEPGIGGNHLVAVID